MDEKTLGNKLQLARKRAKLTQQELCQKAGLSYSTLAKIERGAIRSPSVFTVAAIAQATASSLEELLDIKSAAVDNGSAKKRSKNGVHFVYFDVNGTLARFFERGFTEIAERTHKPIEQIETLYWRYDRPVCEGELSAEQANRKIARELGIDSFDWQKYYLDSVETTPGITELVQWVASNYDVGLLTNCWPGFTQALLDKGLIPQANYTVIVESPSVGCAKPDPRIYKKAQELASAEASEILLIDDTPAYLSGADAAGWQILRFDGMDAKASIQRVKATLEF